MKTNLVNSGVCCQCGSKCFGSEKINKHNHLCNGCRNTSIRNEHNFNNFTLTGPNREKFGKPQYMSIILMSWLQMLRGNFAKDQYFNIHCGYGVKGHSPTGYHPRAMAVDLHVLNIGLGDAYHKIDGVWRGGLGVYPEWNTPGFHLDCGPRREWIVRGGVPRKVEDNFKPGEFPISLRREWKGDRFFLTESGSVVDRETDLEWLAGPDKDMTWYQAKGWVKGLGDGWRMPTTEELKTLYVKGFGTRNITPFLQITGWVVWAGGPRQAGDGVSSAWYFVLYDGKDDWHHRSSSTDKRAFAVRNLKKDT